MFLCFEERLPGSPFVERIWRSRSEHAGSFRSVAMSHWEMVVTKVQGKINLTVRGPESRATLIHCPAGGDWLGIRFWLGTFMPQFPASSLVDKAMNLPDAAGNPSGWMARRGNFQTMKTQTRL